MEHTPTPWTDARGFDLRTLIEFAGTPTRTACTVASVTPEDDGGEAIREAAANAAFIVRACNAHDDLVAALEVARLALLANEPAKSKSALRTINTVLAGRKLSIHDELAAALRGLLGDGPKAGEPGHIDFRDAMVLARAALAKVQPDHAMAPAA